MRRVVLVHLALLAACQSPAERPVPMPLEWDKPVVETGLGRTVADSLAALAAIGCPSATLVSLNDTVVLNQGFGVIRGATVYPETWATTHWIASVTKQFTATAILRLQDSGRLTVDDSIGRFLPGVPPDKRRISIHQLLTHTSGLPNADAADSVRDRPAAIRSILAVPLDHAPGAGFLYSNDNYALLAAIIEIASGTSYEDYLQSRLLEPAHMVSTGFWGSPAAVTVAPTSHLVPSRQIGAHWGQRGSGGIFSTTSDLHRWLMALQRGSLLSESSRSRLFGQYVRTSVGMYGYGWFTSETAWKTPMVWTRGNEDWGPNALIAVYPHERLTVITLSHAFTADDHPCTRLIPPIVEHAYHADH